MDLPQLIEGCKRQDSTCQRELYQQFYPALFTLCKCFFSDRHDILTALNNGMLKVFTHIHQYDPARGSFFSWAYTSVRNAALTLIRDKKHTLTYELTDETKETEVYNPFQPLEWEDIHDYLGQLPANTRCVCTLFYLEGFPIKDISESLQMKEGTVKWHLSEGRNRLRKIFDQHKFNHRG